ncbi:hypothetical protein ACHFJ0_00160 [Paracoccus sp. NGMCC 1.201697]|uniref:Uncharacterized protein n=1 Tax=Paracoccus broussonetiae subsp. drimophilus TaxID=3373869 RepID=A0ABW7LET7_9RHOB
MNARSQAQIQERRTQPLRLCLLVLALLLLALLPGPRAPDHPGGPGHPYGDETVVALNGQVLAARPDHVVPRPLPLTGLIPTAPPAPLRRIAATANPQIVTTLLADACTVTPRARAPPSRFPIA